MEEIYLTRLARDTRHVGVYTGLKVVNVLVLRHNHFHVSTSGSDTEASSKTNSTQGGVQ